MSGGAGRPWRPTSPRAPVLALLGGLFLLRVVGQVVVTYAGVGWLPAVEHWQSGLLPYPILLVTQVAIVGLITAVVAGVWRGRGRFAGPRPRLASVLWWVGSLYLASMIARYGVTMALRPEWRWFGHTIPIAFHCILAVFLIVYSGALGGRHNPATVSAVRKPTSDGGGARRSDRSMRPIHRRLEP